MVQRGNNKQPCFFGDVDFRVYLRFLETYSSAAGCDVHAYALMTNHTHLLVTPASADSAAKLMKALAQNFTHYMNRRHQRTGSLWEGRYWSGHVGEPDYLMRSLRYIERNPMDAGMCDEPDGYPWTSYAVNAGLAQSTLVKPHPCCAGFGSTKEDRCTAYREFINTSPSSRERLEIEAAVKGGFAWGSEAFLKRIAGDLGPTAVRRRGPQRDPED